MKSYTGYNGGYTGDVTSSNRRDGATKCIHVTRLHGFCTSPYLFRGVLCEYTVVDVYWYICSFSSRVYISLSNYVTFLLFIGEKKGYMGGYIWLREVTSAIKHSMNTGYIWLHHVTYTDSCMDSFSRTVYSINHEENKLHFDFLSCFNNQVQSIKISTMEVI